jgi:D-arabinose 1-dehydrogenase-like Zn-dependent alcohol dehydrogenase
MPSKMHAAVVKQFGKPLSLVELDIPSPGPGEILVKTEACGVCHTDLHAAHGDWPVKPTLPFIPGHEAIGLVVAVGSGVKIVNEGDRVGVPLPRSQSCSPRVSLPCRCVPLRWFALTATADHPRPSARRRAPILRG